MITQFVRTVRRTFKVGAVVSLMAGTAYGVVKVMKWKRAPEPMLVPVPTPPRRVPTPAPEPARTPPRPRRAGASSESATAGGPTDTVRHRARRIDAGERRRQPPGKDEGNRVSTGRAKSPNKARVVTR